MCHHFLYIDYLVYPEQGNREVYLFHDPDGIQNINEGVIGESRQTFENSQVDRLAIENRARKCAFVEYLSGARAIFSHYFFVSFVTRRAKIKINKQSPSGGSVTEFYVETLYVISNLNILNQKCPPYYRVLI